MRRYHILDTPPDGAFDRITALAAHIFDVPIALVTIVDEDRIWFKSRHGLDAVQEIPRDPGLCASAIMSDDPYIVESARTDPRTLTNPLVAGELGLQFYAAAPLRTPDGFRLGTLCLLDRQPRRMSAREVTVLDTLAKIVVDELEVRMEAMRAVADERVQREESARLARENQRLYERELRIARTLQDAMLPRSFPDADSVSFDAIYIPSGVDRSIGGDWYDVFCPRPKHLVLSVGDVAGHGLHAATLMGKLRQSLRAIALEPSSPAKLLQSLEELLHDEGDDVMVSAVVAAVNLETLEIEYANAGHCAPLLRAPNGELAELPATGTPLGVDIAARCGTAKLRAQPGAVLLFYTDGLTEAMRDPVAGEQALKAAFADPGIALAPKPAAALCAQLLKDVPRDDVVIMTARFE